MGIAERRERERALLRTSIVEAALAILWERGVAGLSIRAIADRIEYSPTTIYHYFRNKDELIQAVVAEGVSVLERYLREGLATQPVGSAVPEINRALAHAYIRFAVENTAHFRVMFELPGVPRIENGGAAGRSGVALAEEQPFALGVAVMKRAISERIYEFPGGAEEGALVGWSLVHGLVTLYLSGHFCEAVPGPRELEAMVDAALDSVYRGWKWRSPDDGG